MAAAPLSYHINRAHGTITINPSRGQIVVDEADLRVMLADLAGDYDLTSLVGA